MLNNIISRGYINNLCGYIKKEQIDMVKKLAFYSLNLNDKYEAKETIALYYIIDDNYKNKIENPLGMSATKLEVCARIKIIRKKQSKAKETFVNKKRPKKNLMKKFYYFILKAINKFTGKEFFVDLDFIDYVNNKKV